MKNVAITLIISLFLQANLMALARKGIRYVNGDLTGTYERINWQNGQNRLSFGSSAGLGYFFFDNFSMGLSLPVNWYLLPNSYAELGIKLSTNLYLTKGLISPYLGLDLTPKYKLQKDNNEFRLSMGASLGTLVNLSEAVALDLGLRPEVHFKLNKKQNWKLELPFGFVGVRAYF